MDLAEWLASPTGYHGRDCPACGDSMVYPTACRCDYERRVFALAGLADDESWTRSNLVKVNRAMRALDESHLFPIRGRFNATDRAIRRAREFSRLGGCCDDGLAGYVRQVDYEIGRIVNSGE